MYYFILVGYIPGYFILMLKSVNFLLILFCFIDKVFLFYSFFIIHHYYEFFISILTAGFSQKLSYNKSLQFSRTLLSISILVEMSSG